MRRRLSEFKKNNEHGRVLASFYCLYVSPFAFCLGELCEGKIPGRTFEQHGQAEDDVIDQGIAHGLGVDGVDYALVERYTGAHRKDEDGHGKAPEINFLSMAEWEIVMDSMVDGTGKEILAGTDDNIRRVKLQVYFADPNAILAVVPPESGGLREDPLEDDGVNVLLFVREDDLEAKLDTLRVS